MRGDPGCALIRWSQVTQAPLQLRRVVRRPIPLSNTRKYSCASYQFALLTTRALVARLTVAPPARIEARSADSRLYP